MEKAIIKVPTLAELIEWTPEKEKENKLLYLLNNNPPEKWIKTLPKTSVKYLPIERVEFLLTKVFGEWHVEVKSVQLIANSIVVSVRLFYTHPTTGDELWQDGVGAFALQTDSGAGATDISKLKTHAVMMSAPAAETEAIKDAAHKIGCLFGKNLNRSEQVSYESLLPSKTTEQELRDLYNQKKNLFTPEECKNFERILDNKEVTSYAKVKVALESRTDNTKSL